MEEQLTFFGFTADSPQGDTVKPVRGQPRSETLVLPKETKKKREALPAITLEEIASRENLTLAFQKVRANKGSAGADGKSIKEVEEEVEFILTRLKADLLEGKYEPGDIRRVWIPKPYGSEKRGLGIPNVVDRIVQQAIHQVMSPTYEMQFHPSSHGFRPAKSCHTAITEAKSYVEEGYEWVVDIDLEKFFDRVHHDRLVTTLEKKVADRRVLKLIRQMLKAKVILPEGLTVATEQGVPQGGPLSPLLSNIVLDELDQKLAERGHRFVRYADDCNIYVRSERAGHRVMASVSWYIEKRLKLKVNAEKSAVAKPSERHFLGFRLERNPSDGKVSIRLSRKTREKINATVKEKTPRNWGNSVNRCIAELNEYLQGWMGYFRICTIDECFTLSDIDGHIRRRLRAVQLKHWKRKRFVARHLIRLGVKPQKVWPSVYYGNRSWWKLSICQVVHRGLCNQYFAERGLYSLLENWKRWNALNQVRVPRQLSLELG